MVMAWRVCPSGSVRSVRLQPLEAETVISYVLLPPFHRYSTVTLRL